MVCRGGRRGHYVRDRCGRRGTSCIAPGQQPSFPSIRASERAGPNGDAAGSDRHIDLDRDPAPFARLDRDPDPFGDRCATSATAPDAGKAARGPREANRRGSDERLRSAVYDRPEGTRSLQAGVRELMGAARRHGALAVRRPPPSSA